MFALVEFVSERTKEGTTACQVVHFSWLTPDQSSCYWPGNSSYFGAFKNCKIPGKKWKCCPVKVKFVSDDVHLVRKKCDIFLDQSEIEVSTQESIKDINSKGTPRSPRSPSADSESSDSDAALQTFRAKPPLPHKLAAAPSIDIQSSSAAEGFASFGYLEQESVDTSSSNASVLNSASVIRNAVAKTSEQVSIAIQTETLKKVKILIAKVDALSLEVRSLKASGLGSSVELPSSCPKLPLTTEEGLTDFEIYLSDPGNLKQLSAVSATVGGTSVKEATERVMAYIVANSLAVQYNWRGTHYKNKASKLAFNTFKYIFQLIKDSVRVITKGNGTDLEIENCIKYWLKHAKGRLEPDRAEEEN